MKSQVDAEARPKLSKGLKAALIAGGVVLLVLVGALGVTIGMLSKSERAPAAPALTAEPTPTEEPVEVDDSGALSALVSVRDAVKQAQESGTYEDCVALAWTANSMSNATPLDSYRGTYEGIDQALRTLAANCGDETLTKEAGIVMRGTWTQAVEILNERAHLGTTNWE